MQFSVCPFREERASTLTKVHVKFHGSWKQVDWVSIIDKEREVRLGMGNFLTCDNLPEFLCPGKKARSHMVHKKGCDGGLKYSFLTMSKMAMNTWAIFKVQLTLGAELWSLTVHILTFFFVN